MLHLGMSIDSPFISGFLSVFPLWYLQNILRVSAVVFLNNFYILGYLCVCFLWKSSCTNECIWPARMHILHTKLCIQQHQCWWTFIFRCTFSCPFWCTFSLFFSSSLPSWCNLSFSLPTPTPSKKETSISKRLFWSRILNTLTQKQIKFKSIEFPSIVMPASETGAQHRFLHSAQTSLLK